MFSIFPPKGFVKEGTNSSFDFLLLSPPSLHPESWGNKLSLGHSHLIINTDTQTHTCTLLFLKTGISTPVVTEHFQEDIPMGITEGPRGPCVSLLGAAICHRLILTEWALIFRVTDRQLKQLGLLLTPGGLEDLPGWGGESHILGLCAGEGGLFENSC